MAAIKSKKRKKKKVDMWAIPKERCLPIVTYESGGEKTTLDGENLFRWIYTNYRKSDKWRSYYAQSLPLEYVEELKKYYDERIERKRKYVPLDRADTIYQDYMHSAEWQEKRNRIISERKVCETCNTDQQLQVHHKTYKHFTNENDSELMLLCHKCHCEIHGRNF